MAEDNDKQKAQHPAENISKEPVLEPAKATPVKIVAPSPQELPPPPPPEMVAPGPAPAPQVLPPAPTPAPHVLAPAPTPAPPVLPPAPAPAPALPAPPAALPPAPAAPLAEGEAAPAVSSEIEKPARKFDLPLLFGRYSFEGVEVHDPGLKRYININPIAIPHTNARYSSRPFSKQKVNIVERLVNGMMRTEHATGEKARTYRMVRDAFRMIEEKTKLNPIQVLVDAVERSSPREEVTRLKYGGISVPKAVDTSSYRRVNIAIKNLCQGVVKSSRGSKKRIEQVLADELSAASRGDVNSFAIAKKGEIERVAASAR
jgi:small subunit ribosomal protein S7